MRTSKLLWLALGAALSGCSLYLPIRVKNTSDAAITLRYKIQPLRGKGLMQEQVFITGENRMDTLRSGEMDARDSVITFTLQPGEGAILGRGRVAPRDQLLSAGKAPVYPDCERQCMNLYWMRMTQNGVEHTYTPAALLKALKKRNIPFTLVSDERAD